MWGLLIFLAAIVLFIWWGMRERYKPPFDSAGLDSTQPPEGKDFANPFEKPIADAEESGENDKRKLRKRDKNGRYIKKS